MALGEPALARGKVASWRDIDRVGAGAVVDGEVEAIAAGSRGMRARCSGERGAIGLEARNWLITGLIGGLIPCAGFTRRSRRGFARAVRPRERHGAISVMLLSLVAQPAPG